MDKKKPDCKISGWRKTIQTFWPIFVVVVGVVVWAVKSQTVSNAAFSDLRTRVTIVEEQVPSKDDMLTIHKNQAVMRAQLDLILKHVDPHGE